MQEHSNKLGIFLTFNDVECLVDIFLLENEVVILLYLRFLLQWLYMLWFFEEGTKDVVIIGLFLSADGENSRGKLLVVLIKEGCDV